ncbi:unnamed protein product [Mytilus coruscus]|uniref:Ig-like domain-containing protein n=1 Tax=Mytilus coruscus TaxID=42192 RepID=A0A6J8DYP6_MYTCO|nr:unnamed protein product [Mytilus coruscus]
MIGSSAEKIEWIVLNATIVFNEDLFLMCIIENETGLLSNTRKWKVENTLIMFNGHSSNESKYEEQIASDGFMLIIKKLNVEDVNKQYSCSYEFETFTNILLVNGSSYAMYPTDESLKTSKNSTERDLTIYLIFTEVYPMPECNITTQNNDTPISTMLSAKKKLFYEVVVLFNFHLPPSITTDSVQMECKIGHLMIQVPIQESAPCKPKEENKQNVFFVLFVISLGINVFLLPGYLCSKHVRKKCRKLMQSNSYNLMKQEQEAGK